MDFEEQVKVFQHNTAALREAVRLVGGYLQMLQQHPMNGRSVQAQKKVKQLAHELGRDVLADMDRPSGVEAALRVLSSDHPHRPILRNYKTALALCRKEGIEEDKLRKSATTLQRDFVHDLEHTEEVRTLLADLRSMQQSDRRASIAVFTGSRREIVHKTLNLFGWVCQELFRCDEKRPEKR